MKNWIVLTLVALTATACSVRTPEKLGDVEIKQNGAGSASSSSSSATSMEGTAEVNPATAFGERYDADAEEVIATDTLKAWRVAVKHAKQGTMPDAEWKQIRQADEKEAMRQLVDLKERYPQSSTVKFMMGQVEDHMGNHEQAVKYFSESTENNTHNHMYLFKLAQSESKAKHWDKAIEHYRMINKENKSDWYVKLGLAKALIAKDPKSAEAQSLLSEVLKEEPDNVEAKSLLAK